MWPRIPQALLSAHSAWHVSKQHTGVRLSLSRPAWPRDPYKMQQMEMEMEMDCTPIDEQHGGSINRRLPGAMRQRGAGCIISIMMMMIIWPWRLRCMLTGP